MNQALFETSDITARRHKNNPASVKANPSASAKMTDSMAILAWFKRKFQGTSKEVAADLGRALNTISGRFTWLISKGYLMDTGTIAADKCRLLRITQKGIEA